MCTLDEETMVWVPGQFHLNSANTLVIKITCIMSRIMSGVMTY